MSVNLYDLLADLESYMNERAGLVDDSYGFPEPNREMMFLGRIERELEYLECHVCHREKDLCECPSVDNGEHEYMEREEIL